MKSYEIKQRYDSLRSQRRTIEQTYQDIEEFVCPYRGEFFEDMDSEHEQRSNRRGHYDSTAIYAAKSLKSHIHGMLISPATKWFGLRYRTDKLNDNKDARLWLEESEERVYQALVQSNFNIQTAEFLYDMVTYGMGFIIEEVEDEVNWKGVDFKTVGVREAFFETDHKGDLINFYRRLQWSPLQVMDKFGDDTPKDIVEMAESAAGIDSKIEIILCIYKRNDAPKQEEVMPADKRLYGRKYIRHSDANMLGDEGGYYEMPAFYAIWDSTSSSKFGNSPAMTCLSDVKNANFFLKEMREQAALANAPPMLTTDNNVIGDMEMKARGLTVVRKLDNVREMVTGARFDVSEATMNGFRASIERAFLMDSLQLKESPAMTATEVQARYDLMMRNISHTLGSLQTNFLDKSVTRTLNILYRSKRLSPMPDIVKQEMEEFDITYTGPMPRAQKNDDIFSTRSWIQDSAILAELQVNAQQPPDVLDVMDIDQIERDLGLKAGVPTKYIRSKEEVKAIRDKRNAEAAKQQKLAQAQQAGQAMESVGKGQAAIEASPGGDAALEAVL